MTDDELMPRVRELHARGLSPREVARTLGVRPAAVAHLVRRAASERDGASPQADVAGCWISPGWSDGLSIAGHPEWVDPGGSDGAAGLVVAVVARRRRHRREATVCTYLVDVYCLGVKNAIGPRNMDDESLRRYADDAFSAYDGSPVPAPLELVCDLVLGAVQYARGLGFAPHPDFEAARAHLGPWQEPSAITFGRDGRPLYIAGPHDDADRILRTLNGSAGRRGLPATVQPSALPMTG